MTVAQLIERLRGWPDWYEVSVGRQPARFETHCASCDDDECEGIDEATELQCDDPDPRREGIAAVLL